MSRGPGRVEQAIEATFTRFPDQTFSTAELAPIVYPGLNRVEKKHRVSIIRAADKVARRIAWGIYRTEARGGEFVCCNLLNLRSYALGMLRTMFPWNCNRTIRQLEELLDNPDIHMSRWADVQPGGVWAMHVERRKADLAGNTAEGERLREELARISQRNQEMMDVLEASIASHHRR